MLLSHADLRHIMETAFVPSLCKCTITADGLMSLELSHPRTQAEEFSLSGIPVAQLDTGRAIASLVLGIREEVRLRQVARPLRAMHQA
ncbi:DUF1652 domain-containing protein [Pseudomonas sp. 21LCFQ02]|uniref:DUF1652 domain-containing protein n=1 Tax=unclassified Pseudomonas TaxID=196821 RepID=UPI0004F70A2D|nr:MULTISPECIES: DUF1652 domain-containing protein [unclassified Pseudomonas]MCO8165490.1 DUF1652 domain-containing protein [Pseudomonas sp. 21LCFQ010]MCO8168337.1 DUF1652 domain-containing protein [Pseudomonas sp. 21LCFQ02]MCQ9426272.1 DUF1652 domain-containing protein [Pseudomonas sp. LJDD11]BAP41633.1 putative uncharacterized protein [Pseudomonas sp. StFLB209]